MLDEGRSDGVPPEKLHLPALPPSWRARWCRKKGHLYIDARRRGTFRGKPPRLCRRADCIVAAVEALEAEILRHGEAATALSTAQRVEAAEAFDICDRLGVRLLDMVREFERTHPHGPNARTLDQLRLEVVASKIDLERSEKHAKGIDYRMRKLIAAIGDKPVASITTDELARELKQHRGSWNATTVNSVVQQWKIAFNYAKDHGYLVNNPADRLELPRQIRKEPTSFSIKEVRTLLAATLFADCDPLRPACRAYLAIGLFAGLRPEEIERLEWRHIDLPSATLRVPGANAKDRERRIVEIQPTLAAWLAPLVRRAGKVLTAPLAKLRVTARAILGLKAWPADIMRHTFVSYHFAHYQNEGYTKAQVGHRDDGRVFYHNYMVPKSRAEARLFWSTIPPVDVLPCYDLGWLEAHPPVRLAIKALPAPVAYDDGVQPLAGLTAAPVRERARS